MSHERFVAKNQKTEEGVLETRRRGFLILRQKISWRSSGIFSETGSIQMNQELVVFHLLKEAVFSFSRACRQAAAPPRQTESDRLLDYLE